MNPINCFFYFILLNNLEKRENFELLHYKPKRKQALLEYNKWFEQNNLRAKLNTGIAICLIILISHMLVRIIFADTITKLLSHSVIVYYLLLMITGGSIIAMIQLMYIRLYNLTNTIKYKIDKYKEEI